MRRRGVIPPILLVGLGKMGSAMLSGWREQGLSASFAVDPSSPASPGPEVTVVAEPSLIPADFEPHAIVMAVKPQSAADVLPGYARFGQAVLLSIMAGKTISYLQAGFGGGSIVRAMPNTPAAIRQGITVACAAGGVTQAQRHLCHTLLEGVGVVEWVDDESVIDPVTAVSGGGPAYVFLLAELLEKAAVEQGVPAALARMLARQTVAGSGALLAASPEDAAQLRRNVTSPKGTTERALAVLMDDAAWPQSISRAIAAATARSRELAG
jgi:pyrroline-5-carboxylate reductase